jgi:hypothetical protein
VPAGGGGGVSDLVGREATGAFLCKQNINRMQKRSKMLAQVLFLEMFKQLISKLKLITIL